MNALGFEGGAGSVLAVTAQNAGSDQLWNTADDMLVLMNQRPGTTSVDANANDNCTDLDDRVRGFAGHHSGGVVFAFADGSTRLISESIEPHLYRALSTIRGQEIATDYSESL